MARVENKVAMVTGAASGIGRATAELLAAEGARVAVTDIKEEEGRATAEKIKEAEGKAAFYRHDVTSEDDWVRVLRQVWSDWRSPDILANIAGIYAASPLEEATLEAWRNIMDVNAAGTFLGIKHLAPYMKEVGGGSIINMSSVAGIVGVPSRGCYGASKGAARTLTKGAAIELAGKGIRVNSVHPGFIDTPMGDYVVESMGRSKEKIGELHPMGRVGTPREVANAVLYLASDESSFVTGAELVIDGGYSAQ